jgi:hypothetical protein
VEIKNTIKADKSILFQIVLVYEVFGKLVIGLNIVNGKCTRAITYIEKVKKKKR